MSPVCILLTFLCGISSYTFECQGVDGTLPLNQAFRLPKYTLIVRVLSRPSLGEIRCADRRRRHPHQFTRAPTVGAITPSTILTAQPANAVARAPSAVVGGSQPVNAASPTATSAPRRTASTVSIGLPPSSPPRATAPKSTKSKRSKPAAGANGEAAKPTKRRKLTTDEAPVASTSGTRVAATPAASTSAAPTPAPRKKRRKAASNATPVSPTSTGPIPSTGSATGSVRINPLTVKEQGARRKNDEVLQQWTAEWVSRAEARHEREQPLKMAGAVDGEGHETENRLFQLINGRIRERARYGPPLDSDSPARRHIANHPATVEVLARLAADSFLPPPLDCSALRRIDYDPFVSKDDGVVLEPTECEADSLGAVDDAAQYYLRSLVFPDVATLRSFLSAYQEKYGDECWTAATLRSLELSELEDSAPVALHYAGLTIRSGPGGRAIADGQKPAGARRCINILRLARELQAAQQQAGNDDDGLVAESMPGYSTLELIVHELAELRLPASAATDANQPIIGDTEVALIAAIKPAAFNSADGGRLLRVDPSAVADYANLVAHAGATRAALDLLAPLDPPLDPATDQMRRIKCALDDALEYYANHEEISPPSILDPTSEGGRRAYNDIHANMSALRTRLQGRGFRSFEFLLTKDITASSLEGRELFSSAGAAARGPAAGQLLERIVQGLSPQTNDDVWRDLTPSADLWGLILIHWLLLLAILFAIRVLHVAQPLLLVTHAGVINDYIRQNYFRDLLDPESESLDTFLNAESATTPELVDSIRSSRFEPPEQRDLKAGGWISNVGSTAVIRYGPVAQHTALHLAQLDPGFFKYNPIVQDEAVALFAAAAAKTALCRRVLAAHLARSKGIVSEEESQRLDFFRQARKEVEQLSTESGLEAKLISARQVLSDRFTAINSHRALAANQRRIDVDLEDEIKRRSAAALKGVENRSERPAFVGKPLANGDLAMLDPLFDNDMISSTSLPSSCPRLVALKFMIARHEEALVDGLISPALEVAVGPVGSREYCHWYLTAPEGAELARSAIQVGFGELRAWTDERRESYLANRLATEDAKRAARGVQLQGELSLVEALAKLREDEAAETAATTGRGSRKDVYLSTCRTCQAVFMDANFELKTSDHACGEDAFVRIPILFSSSLALLLGESLLDLEEKNLPTYKAVTARSLIPTSVLSGLPFDPSVNPTVHIPVGAKSEYLFPLGIDALLISTHTSSSSASDRILSSKSSVSLLPTEVLTWLTWVPPPVQFEEVMTRGTRAHGTNSSTSFPPSSATAPSPRITARPAPSRGLLPSPASQSSTRASQPRLSAPTRRSGIASITRGPTARRSPRTSRCSGSDPTGTAAFCTPLRTRATIWSQLLYAEARWARGRWIRRRRSFSPRTQTALRRSACRFWRVGFSGGGTREGGCFVLCLSRLTFFVASFCFFSLESIPAFLPVETETTESEENVQHA